MSWQTIINEKLSSVIAMLNQINTNAKKVDELPEQSVLDLSSKIHVSRAGVSEQLELQALVSAITNSSYDQIIYIEEIVIVDNELTIPAGAQAKINDVTYNTSADTEITIPYAGAGLNRTDILVFNTSGEIVLEQGVETAGIAVRPNIPIDTVLVTEINVTDGTIGDLEPVITGDGYRNKIEKGEKLIEEDNTVDVLVLNEKASYRLAGTMEMLRGLNFDPATFSPLYDGREFTIKNAQAISLVLVHNDGSVDYPFMLPENANLELLPGEMAKVKYSKLGDSCLEFVTCSKLALIPTAQIGFMDIDLLSTDLVTQDLDGIVTYINAIDPAILVPTNTDAKFHVTDTGQTFELRVNGAYYGDGCTPITTADVRDNGNPALMASTAYVDAKVVGLLKDRGNYDASGNVYPSTGGSGTAGAIKKGDLWYINVAGVLNGINANIGDSVRCLTDTPGQTASNWAVGEGNIGYVPENTANKGTTMTGNTASNVVFLTAKAVYDWGVGKFQDALDDTVLGALINGYTDKATPVDADYFVGMDSADSNKAKKFSWVNIKATLLAYFDTKYSPLTTGQKTISANETLDDTYNGCMVKIKGTATITVPSTLMTNFICTFDAWAGFTGTFVAGSGATIIETTLTLAPGKMATLYKDGATANYKLKGETT